MAKPKQSTEIIFKCKEPGCPLTITYTPRPVYGFKAQKEPRKTKTIYLTCEKNHTHPYSV